MLGRVKELVPVVRLTNGSLCVRISNDPPVNRHKPSVDYLFLSVAKHCGARCVGVILTGMGADGAKGLLELRKAGARTIGQDEASSVVYGMPKAAADLGAVDKVVNFYAVADTIVQALTKKREKVKAS